MHHFSTPWKHQKTVMFSGSRERVHWEDWVKTATISDELFTSWYLHGFEQQGNKSYFRNSGLEQNISQQSETIW